MFTEGHKTMFYIDHEISPEAMCIMKAHQTEYTDQGTLKKLHTVCGLNSKTTVLHTILCHICLQIMQQCSDNYLWRFNTIKTTTMLGFYHCLDLSQSQTVTMYTHSPVLLGSRLQQWVQQKQMSSDMITNM